MSYLTCVLDRVEQRTHIFLDLIRHSARGQAWF